LWPVDSEAASALMIRFHAYRKLNGLSTVAALRKAQLSMLNGDDERYHQPFDWAPFAVFGGEASF
jgi:CHAT domain-containing protein